MPCAHVRLVKSHTGAITAAELETAGEHVRAGDALLVNSGGSQGRFFARDAVGWMINRGVILLGADIDRYDTGFVNPTGMFIDLFKAEIPIIAGLVNCDQLTRSRFELIVAPLPVQGVGTVPARVLAVERD
jgi:kynurenine formamidase